MSGIVGVLHRDGRPADGDVATRMAGAIGHRGQDGCGIWSAGPVVLGNLLLRVTPEACHDRLPLVSQDGSRVLVADARIDNRSELCALLGDAGKEGTTTDGELILHAYERWGERCPEHLLGDFAFALWDAQRHRLFCARDHFGIRPFYYYLSDEVFAFASEIRALWCAEGVPRRLNEVQLAYYLAEYPENTRSTLYLDVMRLPPAHTLTVTPDATAERVYWQLDPSRRIVLPSDADYAEAFRDVFTEAVRCRARSEGRVGTALSGGLDSSSVTCVAREIAPAEGREPIETFSAMYDAARSSDERAYIYAVVDQGGVCPHYVHPDRLSPLTDWIGEDEGWDEPLLNAQMALHWELYRATAAEGVHIILDGHGGDDVVSHGFEHIRELLATGRWMRAGRQALALRRRTEIPLRTSLWTWGMSELLPKTIVATVQEARGHTPAGPLDYGLLRSDFMQRTAIRDRLETDNAMPVRLMRSARWSHWSGLQAETNATTFEIASRAAALAGIEAAYPFFDRRLVEFCLAIPGEQKIHDGWTRAIMRRAMAGILPEKVRLRPGKSNLGEGFTLPLRQDAELLIRLCTMDLMSEYLDMNVVRSMCDYFLQGRADGYVLWRISVTARWLARSGLLSAADAQVGIRA